MYRVTCGNIGEVYAGDDRAEVHRVYARYVRRSILGMGRASGEAVYLWHGDEIVAAHDPIDVAALDVHRALSETGNCASWKAGDRCLQGPADVVLAWRALGDEGWTEYVASWRHLSECSSTPRGALDNLKAAIRAEVARANAAIEVLP